MSFQMNFENFKLISWKFAFFFSYDIVVFKERYGVQRMLIITVVLQINRQLSPLKTKKKIHKFPHF